MVGTCLPKIRRQPVTSAGTRVIATGRGVTSPKAKTMAGIGAPFPRVVRMTTSNGVNKCEFNISNVHLTTYEYS